MKRFHSAAILAFSVLGCLALPAAETKSPPTDTKSTAASSLAGTFDGKWKSTTGSGGALRIKFKPGGAATWAADATFTFEGADVPTTIKSMQVDGARIELVFDWVIDGTAGQSKLTGELKADTLEGAYETSGAAGASKGTWTVTRSSG